MKRKAFLHWFLLAAVLFSVATVFAMEEGVLTPASSLEKGGVIFSLEKFSREEILRNGFPGHRWEWAIGIKNANPGMVTVQSFIYFENDVREAFGSYAGQLVLQPGEKVQIPQSQEVEFWGLLPGRRTGWLKAVFSGGRDNWDNFMIRIRLE